MASKRVKIGLVLGGGGARGLGHIGVLKALKKPMCPNPLAPPPPRTNPILTLLEAIIL
jgi:hypothetical protein